MSRPILDCYPIRKYGTKRRSFNPSWYKQYRWLEYSSEHSCVFCYSCHHFQSGVSHADQAFTTYGFSDWKHATGAFGALAKHDKCHTHREIMLNWAQFLSMKETGTSVANQLSSARQEQVKKNRFYIKSVSEVILLCARNDIALRAHNESAVSIKPGNFRSILQLVTWHDPSLLQSLQKNPSNATYLSPEIQNELLQVMGDILRHQIQEEVNKVGFLRCFVMNQETYQRKSKWQLYSVMYLMPLFMSVSSALSMQRN